MDPHDSARRSPWLAPLVFVTTAGLLAGWRYAAWGFNPTDDGFVLAYARRILEGQVPHRDFIAIHLAGSGYLHAPFVAFGGEHTYLISRVFVWVQLAFIAWAWTEICARLTETRPPPVMQVAIALMKALADGVRPLRLLSVEDNPFGRVVLNAILTELGEPNLARSTLEGYAILWDRHVLPRIGGVRLRDLTPQVLERPLLGAGGRRGRLGGQDDHEGRARGALRRRRAHRLRRREP